MRHFCISINYNNTKHNAFRLLLANPIKTQLRGKERNTREFPYAESSHNSDGIEVFREERRESESPHYTEPCHREIEESD